MVRTLYEWLGEGDCLCYSVKNSKKCKFVPRVFLMTFAVALACASLSHTWEVTKTFSQARILLWVGQAEMERNPG